MRIPLSTDLTSRSGATDKDALMQNCFVEIDGEQSAAIKRPAVLSVLATNAGTAQGGIANGSVVMFFNGDTMATL